MDADIPQWMPQAYVRAIQAAGSELPKEKLKEACKNLVERWSSDDRHYHTLRHLIDTVTNVEKLIPEMHKPDLVRLAAWYHGVVFSTEEASTYTRNGGEDEQASAEFALQDLLELGVPEKNAQRVAELVAGIRSKTSENTGNIAPDETSRLDLIDIDLQALRDAHMGTLSTEPQRYKTYIGLVRKEYSHIPLLAYLTARRTIMNKLLKRPVLFLTPLARQWEGPARENLAAEVERIDAKIEALTSGNCCSEAEQHKRDALASQVPIDPLEDSTTTTAGKCKAVSTAVNTENRSAQSETLHQTEHAVASSPHAEETHKESTSEEKVKSQPSDTAATSHESVLTREEKAISSREPFTDTSLTFTAKDREKLLSSLESCGEMFEPGEKIPSDLTPEQSKQLRREKLAQEVRRRIEERQSRGTRPLSDRYVTGTHERYPAENNTIHGECNMPPWETSGEEISIRKENWPPPVPSDCPPPRDLSQKPAGQEFAHQSSTEGSTKSETLHRMPPVPKEAVTRQDEGARQGRSFATQWDTSTSQIPIAKAHNAQDQMAQAKTSSSRAKANGTGLHNPSSEHDAFPEETPPRNVYPDGSSLVSDTLSTLETGPIEGEGSGVEYQQVSQRADVDSVHGHSPKFSDSFPDSPVVSHSSDSSTDVDYHEGSASSTVSQTHFSKGTIASASEEDSSLPEADFPGTSSLEIPQNSASRSSLSQPSQGLKEMDEDIFTTTGELPPLPSSSRSGMEREPEM